MWSLIMYSNCLVIYYWLMLHGSTTYFLPLTVNDPNIMSLQYFHENVTHIYFQMFCYIFNSWSSCSDVGSCSCVVYKSKFQVSAHSICQQENISAILCQYNHAIYGVCVCCEGRFGCRQTIHAMCEEFLGIRAFMVWKFWQAITHEWFIKCYLTSTPFRC